MTSHTPAGDDLVARLRAAYNAWNNPPSGGLPTDAGCVLEAADRIEALTSQLTQHTGEVERYSLNIPTAQMQVDKNGMFVLASSYDALAAAKGAIERQLAEAKATLAKANDRLPGIEVEAMNGDNLAIALCSYFDDGEEPEGDNGWSPAATAGYEQTIAAIRKHYAAIFPLKDEGGSNG